jgi:hypothetical protein
MIIVEKNVGNKISYEVSGTRVTFDDDLTINLSKREQDEPVHIDICYDRSGELVIGAAAGRAYVAEIDVPARQYLEADDEEAMDEGTMTPEPVPLDMDTVTLTLWAVE